MKVDFELADVHKHTLSALGVLGTQRLEDLLVAVRLLQATNYDYFKLWRKVVTDNAYAWREKYLAASGRNRSYWDLAGTPPSEVELTSAIGVLEVLGIVNRAERREEASKRRAAVDEYYEISLTSHGKEVAERLLHGRRVLIRSSKSSRTTIFVAGAFNRDDIDELYHRELSRACASVGLAAFRIDLSEPYQTITDHIIQGIMEAECVIADLTYARPSVYFEIGFAHGLGVPVALTCRRDHFRGDRDDLRVHFDLEQFKISYWSRGVDGEFSWAKGMEPPARLAAILKVEGSNSVGNAELE